MKKMSIGGTKKIVKKLINNGLPRNPATNPPVTTAFGPAPSTKGTKYATIEL